MSVKVIVGGMVLGSALVLFAGSHLLSYREGPAKPPPPTKPVEKTQWLSPQATDQLIDTSGMPGPLFDGAAIGGPAPPADVRARIDTFARTNHVDIALDVHDETLTAIRFDVSFGGCCGYEGADHLGLRLGRPKAYDGSCLDCGSSGWFDDWLHVDTDRHIDVRGRIRVNRVQVRWEHSLTAKELIARADDLIGQDPETVGKAYGDHWREIEFEHRYLLEVPFDFQRFVEVSAIPLWDRTDLGLRVTVERGKISEVSFEPRFPDDPASEALVSAMKARWGRPRGNEADADWTWTVKGRVVTACCGPGEVDTVTIQKH